jgi:PAS domain S-box-containing protein
MNPNLLESATVALERVNAILGHFKAIVESSDDAIISKDLNGIIQSWNKGAESIFGYTAEEAVGKSVTILIPPEHRDEESGILARVRAGERIDHYETVRRRKDGKLIDISLTVSPIKDPTGRIIGASKIARDITQKKRQETRIRRAHEKLEEVDRSKDHFLAMLSHELRTPLNPILLVASAGAADPGLPEATRADFEMILKNAEMETRIIDDLLDLARVKSGKLRLEIHDINVHEVLKSSISAVKSQAEKKQIFLVENLNDPVSIVSGDSVRLQQVFSNVLRNAVKFTPANGTITVTADSMGGEYVVTISDTGIGMTAAEMAVVFEPFRQGQQSEAVDHCGGLGLGLAISKQFVQQHGGAIEGFSRGPGQGCAFTIKLPLMNRDLAQPGSTVVALNQEFAPGAHFFCKTNDERPPSRQVAG